MSESAYLDPDIFVDLKPGELWLDELPATTKPPIIRRGGDGDWLAIQFTPNGVTVPASFAMVRRD